MFGWFKRNIDDWSTRSMEQDLEKFISIIKGMDDSALGSLLVGAAWARISLDGEGKLPFKLVDSTPAQYVSDCRQAALHISNKIKSLQSNGNNEIASFLMIWLHTVRALGTLELMPLAKEMWKELDRGFPHLNSGFETVQFIANSSGQNVSKYLLNEANYIPFSFQNKSKPTEGNQGEDEQNYRAEDFIAISKKLQVQLLNDLTSEVEKFVEDTFQEEDIILLDENRIMVDWEDENVTFQFHTENSGKFSYLEIEIEPLIDMNLDSDFKIIFSNDNNEYYCPKGWWFEIRKGSLDSNAKYRLRQELEQLCREKLQALNIDAR